MTSRMMKAAMALTVAGAVALPASQAAAGTSKTESAILGAILGGVAGAALGNGKGESVALGAAAGAALGVVADKSNDHNRYRSSAYRYRQSQPYYANGRSAYRGYDRGDYRRTYSPYGQSSYGYSPYGYDYRR
jgi:hypothetical protein